MPAGLRWNLATKDIARAGACPETYANCPSILFGDVGSGSWPVGTGHPCFGCTEEGVGFTKPIHALADVESVTPPLAFASVNQPKGQGITPASAGVVGVAAGAAVGAAAVMASRLGKVELIPEKKKKKKKNKNKDKTAESGS